MTHRDLRCDQLVELLTEYFEGVLDAAEREHVEHHLALCRGCEVYLDQMREAIRQMGRLRANDVAPSALDELLVAFRTEHRE